MQAYVLDNEVGADKKKHKHTLENKCGLAKIGFGTKSQRLSLDDDYQ
jgi:hypothetical protein